MHSSATVPAVSLRLSGDRRIAVGFSERLALVALVISAGIIPVLPPVLWKVKITIQVGLVLAAALYLRARALGAFGRSPLDRPLMAFLAAAALATLFSVDPLVSLYPSSMRGDGLVITAVYVLSAMAAARLSRRYFHLVLAAAVVCGVLVGIVAITQYYGLDLLRWMGFRSLRLAAFIPRGSQQLVFTAVRAGGRASGTVGSWMFLGGYAALLLPLAAWLMLRAKGKVWLAWGAATAVIFGALLASHTRAAWIATVVAGIVLVALLRPSQNARRRLSILAVGLGTVAVVLALTYPAASLTERAASTVNELRLREGTLPQRLFLWKHTLPLIAQRPIVGWGFSSMLGRFPAAGSPEFVQLFGNHTVSLVDNPHNELLALAHDIGLLGVGAYLWIWFAVAVCLLNALRVKDNETRLLAAALTASLAGYFLWMQTGWSHIGPANALWVLLGVSVALGGGAGAANRAPQPKRK